MAQTGTQTIPVRQFLFINTFADYRIFITGNAIINISQWFLITAFLIKTMGRGTIVSSYHVEYQCLIIFQITLVI